MKRKNSGFQGGKLLTLFIQSLNFLSFAKIFTMSSVKLSLNQLEILLNKSRWKLYVVVVAEHPYDNDKMLLTTLPVAGQGYFMLKKRSENQVDFVPESNDEGADGLTVLERPMPDDRCLKVRVFLKHSRHAAREIGNILGEVESGLGGQAFGLVSNMLGSTTPWLVIAKSAFGLIGGILNQINDRDLGYLSLDEEFGEEFEEKKEIIRSNTTTSGDAKLTWSWKIRK